MGKGVAEMVCQVVAWAALRWQHAGGGSDGKHLGTVFHGHARLYVQYAHLVRAMTGDRHG
jgi:hypothetical protein